MHWESLAAFAEQFPRIRTTTDIFVVDGNRRTCSGGTAALDMMLHLVTERDGRALALAGPVLGTVRATGSRTRRRRSTAAALRTR